MGVELFFSLETMTIFNAIPQHVVAVGAGDGQQWEGCPGSPCAPFMKGFANRGAQGSFHELLGRLLGRRAVLRGVSRGIF